MNNLKRYLLRLAFKSRVYPMPIRLKFENRKRYIRSIRIEKMNSELDGLLSRPYTS